MFVLSLILTLKQQIIKCNFIKCNSIECLLKVCSSCTPYIVISTIISVVFIDIKNITGVFTNVNGNF